MDTEFLGALRRAVHLSNWSRPTPAPPRTSHAELSRHRINPIAATTPAEHRAARYEAVLTSQLERLLASHPSLPASCPLVISGMAGSSIGWREVPYAALPFRLSGEDVRSIEPAVTDPRLRSRRIVLMSGVAGDWDMMRGEETEILGLAHWAGPDWSRGGATVVLPGTHSKHVAVADGSIRGIHTHFTGELFANAPGATTSVVKFRKAVLAPSA